MKIFINDLTSGDDARAENGARELISVGIKAIPELVKLLKNHDPEIRWWAIRTLAGIEHEDSLQAMLNALEDEDPGVRQCACLGLRYHPRQSMIPHLIKTLGDRDNMVRSLSADVLEVIGTPAVTALMKSAESGALRTRIEAVKALANIGDERTVPLFISILDEDSALLEYWARKGLEKIGVGMVFFDPSGE